MVSLICAHCRSTFLGARVGSTAALLLAFSWGAPLDEAFVGPDSAEFVELFAGVDDAFIGGGSAGSAVYAT